MDTETELFFWLILLSGWFVYILADSAVKKALLALSPSAVLFLAAMRSNTIIALAGVVLCLSHARFFWGRYGPKRMRRILKRTLVFLLIGVGIMELITWSLEVRASWLLSTVALIWIIAAIKALTTTVWRVATSSYRPRKRSAAKPKLPTVTLAIPARNETHVLTDCLRSAISSDYPKLEIIVLDDCSQDSTPEIIKSFAHDGVRFVSGELPAGGWIGKNQAYQTLLGQASGDIIVFAGVDVRWQPDSISKLIKVVKQDNSKMVSIMPFRSHFDFLPSITRTLRYYWQLAFAALPVMNSAWAAERKWLESVGGIEPFKHSILPERNLARLAKNNGEYKFLLSTPSLGISSRKHALSQFETAIRTLYPQSARDPFLAVSRAALWLVMAGLFVWGWFLQAPIFLLGSLSFLLSYMICEAALQPRGWILSGLMLPLALISQAILTVISMVGYEFGSVEWKGRNICLPAMGQVADGGTYPLKNLS